MDSQDTVKPSVNDTVTTTKDTNPSSAPVMSDHPFLFELPKDIRRIVCDYLPEREYSDLLREDGFFHETTKTLVALLQVKRSFHEEVTACLFQCMTCSST